MKGLRCNSALIPAVLCFSAAILAAPPASRAQDIRYDGSFALASNGDAAVTINLTPPMYVYEKVRESVSNLYLVLRGLASNRADTEVVEKKADFDDSNRTLHFAMKVLGAGHNLGSRWEVEVPKPSQFSNLDESKRTFYFNESADTPAGPIRGVTRLVLPSEAREFKWDESRRVVSYVLPSAGSGYRGILMLWISASILMGIGAVLVVASFTRRPALASAPTAN